MRYFVLLVLSTFISVYLVPIVRKLAYKYKALDIPVSDRKIHKRPTPLLGGISVALTFVIGLSFFLYFGDIDFRIVPLKFFVAIVLSILILSIGGILDDIYTLSAKWSWIFPAVASLLCVGFGIGVGIKFITNPFGGILYFGDDILGVPISAIFTFVWLMGMTYTTKILDGMDGLVSGIGVIAALTLFFLSLTPRVNQPITASLAILLAGACLGFLFYNFNPASIFLGEGGSTLIGFLLGVISIILGGKIATALLVMGIPILDVAWAIFRRIQSGVSPFVGDRKHLHFRLLDIGLNQRQAVYVLWLISAVFGFFAVFLQSLGKLVALVVLVFVMVALGVLVAYVYRRKELKKK